ncbi:MEDS domain-containing protein [Candidatus Daviesbacteria bacterium]|nr:MEDS domain-containing protein [Candidatus Daviesbacteria bacterium]
MKNTDLCQTGIEIIGDVSWGTHFCQFYQTKTDLIGTLVPYFRAGLDNNEFCVWVTSDFLNTEEAIAALQKGIPNFSKYLKKKQIEIFPHTQWYLKGGKFEMKQVLRDWVNKHDQALKKGFAGTRVSGNPFWIDNKKDWDDFAKYEAEINKVIDNYKLLVLCTYSLDKCNSSEIIDVVSNHELALIKQAGKWQNIQSVGYKKIEQSLRQSEGRFRSYIELTGQLGWTTNTKGEVEEDIPSWRKYTGQSYEEVKGTGWTEALHPADVKHTLAVWNKAVRTKSAYETEYRIRRYDGVYFHFLVRGIPVMNENGDIQEWVGTCVDITNRKEMERVKSEFISIASHQLRTPLSAISWAVESLSEIECKNRSANCKKYLEQVDNQTKKMIKLTENMLDVTKMELGVFSFKYEEINPLKVALKVIEDYKDQIKNKKIKFKFIKDTDIQPYKTYSNAIVTILSNLLSNAVKFTPIGGRIILRIAKKNSQLLIEVSDSGVGIPKSAQAKIFQKAYRATNVKSQFEGTGFGLYITKTMIDRMGGEIIVKSVRRKGTTFRVILPFKQEERKIQAVKLTSNLTGMTAII